MTVRSDEFEENPLQTTSIANDIFNWSEEKNASERKNQEYIPRSKILLKEHRNKGLSIDSDIIDEKDSELCVGLPAITNFHNKKMVEINCYL